MLLMSGMISFNKEPPLNMMLMTADYHRCIWVSKTDPMRGKPRGWDTFARRWWYFKTGEGTWPANSNHCPWNYPPKPLWILLSAKEIPIRLMDVSDLKASVMTALESHAPWPVDFISLFSFQQWCSDREDSNNMRLLTLDKATARHKEIFLPQVFSFWQQQLGLRQISGRRILNGPIHTL